MSRVVLAVAVALASGCEASLGGGSEPADAARVTDARPVDASVPTVTPDARPCMGGNQAGIAPDGSCLILVTTPLSYASARTACMAMNAHLAYLKTAPVDTYARTFVGTNDTWIGGNDLTTEGTFEWDDGTAFAYTNWTTGEPNSGGVGATYQEDCVIIAGARVDKQWDDRPCDSSEVPQSGSFAYLCQY